MGALVVTVVGGCLGALGGAEANAANAADDAADDAEAEEDDHDDPDGDGLGGSIAEFFEAGLSASAQDAGVAGAVSGGSAGITDSGHI